jgi:hypothetical protein
MQIFVWNFWNMVLILNIGIWYCIYIKFQNKNLYYMLQMLLNSLTLFFMWHAEICNFLYM